MDKTFVAVAAPSVTGGRSQAVWTGAGGPALPATGSRTVERHARLIGRLAEPNTTLDALLAGTSPPPLHALDTARGLATVYTAVYHPVDAVVERVWPGHAGRQTFDRFEAGARAV